MDSAVKITKIDMDTTSVWYLPWTWHMEFSSVIFPFIFYKLLSVLFQMSLIGDLSRRSELIVLELHVYITLFS